AAHLGYDPARDHNVVAVAFELPPSPPGNGGAGPAAPHPGDGAAQRQRIWESIEHFVATRAPEAIVSARESEVVVVTTAPEGPGPPRGRPPGGPRLPGRAGRAVPGGQGRHRDRRDLP